MNNKNKLNFEEIDNVADFLSNHAPSESSLCRSHSLKEHYASGLRNVEEQNRKTSLANNTLTRKDALEIYEKTFSCKEGRTHKFYNKLAKEYNVNRYKIIKTANGDHPALADKDVKADVRQHEIKYLGIYKFTSPQGEEYVFDNLYDVGAWIWKTEKGITDKTSHQNWTKGRMWFEKTKPNTLYVKRRRWWKGWEYINIIE